MNSIPPTKLSVTSSTGSLNSEMTRSRNQRASGMS